MKKTVLVFWMIITLLITLSYGAIQGDFVINGVDATTSTKFYRVPASVANGLRVDVTRISAGTKTPADAFTAPTDAITTWSLNAVYNGATWDRVRGGGNNADAVAVATLGLVRTINYLYGWNSTTWDRIKSQSNDADAVAASTTGNLSTVAYSYFWDGADWNRVTGDASFGGGVKVVNIDYEHWKIHSGMHYSAVSYTTLASSAVANWLITAPNTSVRVHYGHILTATTFFMCVLYESPTAGGGTSITVYNNDRNSANTTTTTITSEPTVTSTGAIVLQADAVGSGSGLGGETIGPREYILKQGTAYQLSCQNSSATSGIIAVRFSYYEQ